MATEADLKRQGLWDYERDQPLRRSRPVPDETLDRSKPEGSLTKEQLEKLRMLVEVHIEDNDELGQAAREVLPLLDGLAAEPRAEPSTGPGTLEEIFGSGRSSGGLGDYK